MEFEEFDLEAGAGSEAEVEVGDYPHYPLPEELEDLERGADEGVGFVFAGRLICGDDAARVVPGRSTIHQQELEEWDCHWHRDQTRRGLLHILFE